MTPSFIAIVTCPHCDEQTDVGVHEHMGATDLLPEECPVCGAEWPFDILAEAEVA